MDEIILVGAGGHARSCMDVIELSGQFKIAGLVEKDNAAGQENLVYPVIGTDDDLPSLRQKYRYALVTVGQIKSPKPRKKLYDLVKKLDFKLPVIKSLLSYVSKHANIGEGTIIMHGAIVNANAKIGKSCIINNHSLIEHDAVIADHCHVATGAIINGEVEVGEGTFIGSGVVTNQYITIGKNCVIGSGSILKHNIPDNQLIKN